MYRDMAQIGWKSLFAPCFFVSPNNTFGVYGIDVVDLIFVRLWRLVRCIIYTMKLVGV